MSSDAWASVRACSRHKAAALSGSSGFVKTGSAGAIDPVVAVSIVRGRSKLSTSISLRNPLIVESATITDESGNAVDLKNLRPDGSIGAPEEESEAPAEDAQAEAGETEAAESTEETPA